MADHKAPDVSVTEPGAPTPKPFAGARAVVDRIDVADPDQVFDLAAALENASTRRLMQATLAELRAICAFAVHTGIVASHAARLVALSDSNAPPAEIIAATESLCAAAREINGRT